MKDLRKLQLETPLVRVKVADLDDYVDLELDKEDLAALDRKMIPKVEDYFRQLRKVHLLTNLAYRMADTMGDEESMTVLREKFVAVIQAQANLIRAAKSFQADKSAQFEYAINIAVKDAQTAKQLLRQRIEEAAEIVLKKKKLMLAKVKLAESLDAQGRSEFCAAEDIIDLGDGVYVEASFLVMAPGRLEPDLSNNRIVKTRKLRNLFSEQSWIAGDYDKLMSLVGPKFDEWWHKFCRPLRFRIPEENLGVVSIPSNFNTGGGNSEVHQAGNEYFLMCDPPNGSVLISKVHRVNAPSGLLIVSSSEMGGRMHPQGHFKLSAAGTYQINQQIINGRVAAVIKR